ncbi:MAG TPA: prepilin-type N-terminal cleavage/methylation domain-containing protein [bacterium]|nr:prepilin-type N-terminal cleavage/methylation domain-containing protein [bacterium]HQL63325.1 prepilin-type N-terminal cleavage/methylation domain-containing protein [bacterium]
MRRSAFTLIELLIVVAIIGILAAIAVPNFLNARAKAKIARVWGDFDALKIALETFALDNNGRYPNTNGTANDDYYPMRRLTSPIAYIPALPQKDPFVPRDTGDGMPGGTRDYWWNPYWLVTFPETTLYIVEAGPLRWQIASVGPDQFFDCSPFVKPEVRHSACWLPYHPTNGVNSWGEIYMTGPGGVSSDTVNISARPSR